MYAKGLDVVGAVRSAGEVRQVELDLVPAVVQPHRHRADERLDACRALVVAGAEPSTDVLVVKHLHTHTHAHTHARTHARTHAHTHTHTSPFIIIHNFIYFHHKCGSKKKNTKKQNLTKLN